MDQVARGHPQPGGNADLAPTLEGAGDHQQHGWAGNQENADDDGDIRQDGGEFEHAVLSQCRMRPTVILIPGINAIQMNTRRNRLAFYFANAYAPPCSSALRYAGRS